MKRWLCLVYLASLAAVAHAEITIEDTMPPADFGTAGKRIEEFASAFPARPESPDLVPVWANLHTALRKARFMMKHYRPTPLLLSYLEDELSVADVAVKALKVKQRPPLHAGLLSEGYHSDIDDSFQPFLSYVPPQAADGKKLPLIVFLHGYASYLDLVNWASFPETLIEFAGQEGFLLVAPFGRSNTDFQGVGEQDVLRVIGEMERRYRVDPERVILAGISMGGMGAWTIGAHEPSRFAGLLIVSGRGDYYFWQQVKREELPPYKRQLIDAEFGYSMLPRLARIPTFCIHGTADTLVPVSESRHMVSAVKKINPDLTYVELPGALHWIFEESFARSDIRKWMLDLRMKHPPADPFPPVPPRGRPVKNAFLEPFIFVCASPESETANAERFQGAVMDWYNFAKAFPRIGFEANMNPDKLALYNVFLFGEPEASPLIRQVLVDSPVKVEKDHFVVGGKRYPRNGNGLYLVRPSPWNKAKMAIVQCGLAWGAELPPNHKYDFLPEYIVYSDETDQDGSNTAIAAGFFDEAWNLKD